MSVYVPGYTRKDGSVVKPYRRKRKPSSNKRFFTKKQLALLKARAQKTKTRQKKRRPN